ncbi:hypothetical protein [Vallitalea okinawensis]|uniref:hypothetical protein n=1 Tax=Vallitalea okinawensis TaxID=2078660 RepID=UPI000CFDE70B|nr:hypothetical protein [Vallitalea okinawensis]
MRKLIYTTVIFIFALSLYTINASAATPMSEKAEKLQQLIQEDKEALLEQLDAIDQEFYTIIASEDGEENLTEEEVEEKEIEYDQMKNDAINTIGENVLYLTEGFDNLETSTFNENKTLSMEASEGTILEIYVMDEDGNQAMSIQPSIIGASEMYDITIELNGIESSSDFTERIDKINPSSEELKYIIIIYVRYDEDEYAREFIVNRKSEDTKNYLEGFDVIRVLKPAQEVNDQGDHNEQVAE